MGSRKEEITLALVRRTMEDLARAKGCIIQQIELRHVMDEIGSGSNGTVGAFVKQVKQDHINARAYDRSNISTELKSALILEIDRFANNARENATEELKAISSLNDELCEKVDQADETIRNLEDALKTQQAEAAKEARHLKDELVQANVKIESHAVTIDQQKAELASCRDELAAKNADATTLNRQLGKLEAELKSASTEASAAREALAQAISSREEADKGSALAEQAAAHKQETIDMLKGELGKLEGQLGEMKSQASELSAQHDRLLQKLEEANQERIKTLEAWQRQTAETPVGENASPVEAKARETGKRRGKTNQTAG